MNKVVVSAGNIIASNIEQISVQRGRTRPSFIQTKKNTQFDFDGLWIDILMNKKLVNISKSKDLLRLDLKWC